MLFPGEKYNAITNAQTKSLMRKEAQIFDRILASDGSTGYIDIEDDANPGQPMEVQLYRGKPRAFAQGRQDETPTYTEPRRTLDIFAASRSLANTPEMIEKMQGRTLKFQGTKYTISDVKPHIIADVVLYVEIHADKNDGLFQSVGLGGEF